MEIMVLPPARPVAPPSTNAETTTVDLAPARPVPQAPVLGLLVDTYA